MFRKNRMEYVIKTCSGDDAQELQNLLNEMSMNGWDLYSMHDIGDEESGSQLNCIFMRPSKNDSASDSNLHLRRNNFTSSLEYVCRCCRLFRAYV